MCTTFSDGTEIGGLVGNLNCVIQPTLACQDIYYYNDDKRLQMITKNVDNVYDVVR